MKIYSTHGEAGMATLIIFPGDFHYEPEGGMLLNLAYNKINLEMKEVNRKAEKSIRCNGYTFVIEVRNDQVSNQYDAFITIYKGRVEVGGIGVLGENHKRAHFSSAEAAFMGAERFLDFTTWGTGKSHKHTMT